MSQPERSLSGQTCNNLNDKIKSAYPVGAGGIAEAVTKMAFGNKIGVNLNLIPASRIADKNDSETAEALFVPRYGSIIIETEKELTSEDLKNAGLSAENITLIGTTQKEQEIAISSSKLPAMSISLKELENDWESTLAKVFPPVSSAKPEDSYNLQ